MEPRVARGGCTALERGQIFHSSALGVVDPKGRTSLPQDYRVVVENRLRQTLEPGGAFPEKEVLIGEHPRLPCLQGFDTTHELKLYNQLVERAEAAGPEQAGEVLDELQAGAFGVLEKVGYDTAGRIVLPAHLRAFAGLDDGLAFFLGAGDTFQIWSPERFREHNPDKGPVLRKLDALLAERRK